jgi:hypothetical protein
VKTIAQSVYQNAKKATGLVENVIGYMKTVLGNYYMLVKLESQTWTFDGELKMDSMRLLNKEKLGEGQDPADQGVVEAGHVAGDDVGLQPAGEATDVTDIATALRDSAAAYDKADLAGVLLFSDGLHNASADLPKAAEGLGGLGVPVYAVGVGARTEGLTGRKNLQLLSVEAPYDAVKNNVTTIRAKVQATGLAGAGGTVQLLEDGNVVASARLDSPQTAPVQRDPGTATVTCELKWTPHDAPGRSRPTTDPASRVADVRRLQVVVPPLPEETEVQDYPYPVFRRMVYLPGASTSLQGPMIRGLSGGKPGVVGGGK